MNRIGVVTGVLNSVVQIIVSLPKQARVMTRTTNDAAGREAVCFEIDVHQSDRGKLIGKRGASMRVLRVLLNSAGYLSGARYRVHCNDESDERPTVSPGARFR